MNVNDVRNNFPYLKNGIIYFNHASTGPISTLVLNRLTKLLKEKSENNIDDYPSFLKVFEETKKYSSSEKSMVFQTRIISEAYARATKIIFQDELRKFSAPDSSFFNILILGF